MQLDPIFLANYLDAIERQNMPRYGKGGKVVDLLAESLFGGKKAKKTAPDPSRRKIMGLDPKTVEPGQVAVKETVSKAPKSGTTSVTLEEIANIPMSRRDVLRAGAGQMGRGLLPQGALRSMMELAGGDAPEVALEQVMQQSVKRAPAFVPSTLQGLVAQGLKRRVSEDDMLDFLQKHRPDLDENALDEATMIDMNLRAPDEFDIAGVYHSQVGPLEIMRDLINLEPGTDLKTALREIKMVNPKLYDRLKQTSRDIDMMLGEFYPEP